MKAIMILARDLNGAIGRADLIPWQCSNDMNFFRQTTKDNIVVMGRKTFESVGILPRRKMVVLTKSKTFKAPEGVEVLHSIKELYVYLEKDSKKTAFICGGAVLYTQLLQHVDEVMLTTVYTAVRDPDSHFLSFRGSWHAKATLVYPDCCITHLVRN